MHLQSYKEQLDLPSTRLEEYNKKICEILYISVLVDISYKFSWHNPVASSRELRPLVSRSIYFILANTIDPQHKNAG